MPPASYVRSVFEDRLDGQPSWIVLVELFVGLGWIRAAIEKVIDVHWWQGIVIDSFVADHSHLTLWWFRPFINDVVLPNSQAFSVMIVAGQLIAGAALISGRFLIVGLYIGMTMNLAFILAGAVDPSIFYLLLQAVLALWLFENSVSRDLGLRSLTFIMASAAVLAVASVPFVMTVQPSRVVEDPAMVLVTYSVSIAVSCFVARTRLSKTAGVHDPAA